MNAGKLLTTRIKTRDLSDFIRTSMQFVRNRVSATALPEWLGKRVPASSRFTSRKSLAEADLAKSDGLGAGLVRGRRATVVTLAAI